MFSSHTIYTLTFILTISKYWPHKWLIALMACIQTSIAFLIVAARKHYSLDVFTALYVVPLLWFTLEAYHKDINHKDVGVTPRTVRQFYSIETHDDDEYEMQVAVPLEAVQIQSVDDVGAGHNGVVESEGNGGPFHRKDSV